MDTDLAEIFAILDAEREKYAKALIYAPIEVVKEMQVKIVHIDALKTHITKELEKRRSKNVRNSR